jgi:hypothetical protein
LEILRHHFGQAHNELLKEMHAHPHSTSKLINSINHDLKAHHQHPLSVEHDHGKHISHINFGMHDIYHRLHPHSNESLHERNEKANVPLPPARPAEFKEKEGSPDKILPHEAAEPGSAAEPTQRADTGNVEISLNPIKIIGLRSESQLLQRMR